MPTEQERLDGERALRDQIGRLHIWCECDEEGCSHSKFDECGRKAAVRVERPEWAPGAGCYFCQNCAVAWEAKKVTT